MKNKNLLLISIVAIGIAVVLCFSVWSKGQLSKSSYTPRKLLLDNCKGGIQGAIEYFASMRNNQITKEVNINDVLKARKLADILAKQNKSIGLTWNEVGPDNIGGRTRAILIDRNNSNVMYAGSVSGGLFKSTTGGSSWNPVNDMMQNLAVASIAQDLNGNIYVGTGETFTSNTGGSWGSPGFIGYGIFKSTDGGNNFFHLSSTNPATDNSFSYVNDLACDPVTGKIYAATDKGLRFSTDGGNTWTNPITSQASATDIDVAPDQTVVASVGRKCYISPSGNINTFVNHSTGATNKLPDSGISRIEFAIAPSNSDYIYACAATSALQDLENIYRTTDGGNNWEVIGPGGSSTFNPLANQGSYDNEIAVYPNNPNKIMVGGLDLWEWSDGNGWTQKSLWYLPSIDPRYIHGDHHKYLFHPTDTNIYYIGSDGGVSIHRKTMGFPSYQTSNIGYNVTQFYTICFAGNGAVMGGTQDNGTLYISRHNVNTPMHAQEMMGGDGGYCAISSIDWGAFFTSIYYGGVIRSKNGSSGDAASFLGSRISGLGGDGVEPGDAGFPAAFVTPVLLWESFNDIHSSDSIYFVADKNYLSGDAILIRSKNNDYPFNYILPSALSKDDSIKVQDIVQSKFFFGVTDGVWMTKEALDFSKTPEWYKIATISGTTRQMVASKDGNYVFVSTMDGKLYRISNIATAYDSATFDITSSSCVIETKLLNVSGSGLPTSGRAITSISIDPNDANHVVITLGNYGNSTYIYRSTNALDSFPTFQARQGNLPPMPVYSSLIVMNHSNEVIVGTELGLYATDNISASSPVWSEENTDMARVPTLMIAQQTFNQPSITVITKTGGNTYSLTYPGVTNYGVIYIGTHGRGIFECKKYVGIENKPNKLVVNKPTLEVYPNPAIDNANISFNLYKEANVIIRVFDLSGKIVKSVSLLNKQAGSHRVTIDCNSLPRGSYLIQLVAEKETATAKFVVIK